MVEGDHFEAAVVDFEFAGPGQVAVDLANFLFPDARMNLLPMELELLEFYHKELLKAMEELANRDTFPYKAYRCLGCVIVIVIVLLY